MQQSAQNVSEMQLRSNFDIVPQAAAVLECQRGVLLLKRLQKKLEECNNPLERINARKHQHPGSNVEFPNPGQNIEVPTFWVLELSVCSNLETLSL